MKTEKAQEKLRGQAITSRVLLIGLILFSLVGFFATGRGIGAMLRPGKVYVPIRITHVRVDSVGTGLGGVRVVSDQPGEHGCLIIQNNCNCDSPYGRVEFPAFVECDIARMALYNKEGGGGK